jgi:hypothetical protein
MTTITLTYTDNEVEKFKRSLFAEEAWRALRSIDTILHEKCKPIDKLDAVRDVLADLPWGVE